MKWIFKLFFLLAFTAITMNGFSQIDYRNYHHEINKAEEQFLQKNFNQSIKIYQETFKKYPKFFLRDILIAMQIAALNKDVTGYNNFTIKAFSKGLELKLIKEDTTFLGKSFQKFYDEKTLSDYDSLRIIYLKSLNLKLRIDVMDLLRSDETHHAYCNSERWFEIFDKDKLMNWYDELCDKNIDTLISLTKKHGYISENKIGFRSEDLDEKLTHLTLEPPANLIFYHNFYGVQTLDSILLEAIKSGDLHPRNYAFLYEWSCIDVKYLHDTAGVEIEMGGEKHIWKPHQYTFKDRKVLTKFDRHYSVYNGLKILNEPNYKEDEVNKNRSDIGICDLKHDEIKKAFAEKYGLVLYFGVFEKL